MKLNLHYDGATRTMKLVHAETGEAVEGVQGVSFHTNPEPWGMVEGSLTIQMVPGAVFLENVDQIDVEERYVRSERRRSFRR